MPEQFEGYLQEKPSKHWYMGTFPTNTPCIFHVETTWKRPFPRRFNVEYTWCVCRVNINSVRSLNKEENIDELIVSETKLGKSFWIGKFKFPGYTSPFHLDHNLLNLSQLKSISGTQEKKSFAKPISKK